MTTFDATLGQPFLLSAQGDTGSVGVNFDVTDPAAGITIVPAVEVGATGVYSGSFTPAMVGFHEVEISDAGASGLDGEAMTLNVTAGGLLAVPAGAQWHPGACRPHGGNLRWPCPKLASLPCITSYDVDQILRWTDIATTTVFEDTCRRFPGCDNYIKVRPVVGSACVAPLPPRYGTARGLDLWPTVRYPVVELVDIEVDGASLSPSGWRIEGQRWLVPEGATAWPNQNLQQPDGAAGTWAVLVRYGRPPPALAVAARDQLMLSMLIGNEPPIGDTVIHRLPDGLTSLSENGRSMTFDPESATALHDEAVKRWRCPKGRSRVVDLAEATARGSSVMHVAPSDPTPAGVQIWFPSGCDLTAQLTALRP